MFLDKIITNDNSVTSLYQIIEDHKIDKISTYLFSSPESRVIMFNPYISGNKFQVIMEAIMKRIYDLLTKDLENQKRICVLYILRGGLNFAFHKVIENKEAEVSFISCQRVFNSSELNSLVSEDGYNKINIKNDGVLFIGDISATGITIENILKKVIINCEERNIRISSLYIVMIGTKQSYDYIRQFLEYNNNTFDKINLIYLEALFDLYKTPIDLQKNHLLNTDFFLRLWPRTPEFEIEIVNNLHRLLERCAIYDGGSRSFEPELYKEGVSNYWKLTLDSYSDYTLLDYIFLKTDFHKYREDFNSWVKSRSYFEAFTNNEKYAIYNSGQKSLKKFENIIISTYISQKS